MENNLFKNQLVDLIKHKKIHLAYALNKIILFKVSIQQIKTIKMIIF